MLTLHAKLEFRSPDDAVVLGEWIMKVWKDYNPSEHHEPLTWNSVVTPRKPEFSV